MDAESPNLYCLVAMCFQLLSIITDLVYWSIYSTDGKGMLVLDVASTMFEMISESMMTMIVIMLANGWMSRNLNSSFDKYGFYLPLAVLVLCHHIIIGCLTFVDRDAYHKYHDYSGW